MKKAVIIMAGGLLCSSLTMAAEKADWDKVLEQAKQEGNVTFHVWYLQSQWRIFVQEFEKQYGIKVRIPEGRLDGNVNKLLAEAGKKERQTRRYRHVCNTVAGDDGIESASKD